MGFETINLSDVEQTTGTAAPLPKGEYTLKLLSVKPNIYQEGGLSFDIVVNDGPYARRRVFPTLPPPVDKNHWSAQAAAKLMNTLGIEQGQGESVIDAFNRAANNGHATFIGTTKQYESKTKGTQPDLEWFSVRPSA